MNIVYQDKILYPEILWERPVHYYKAKAGRVLLIAGSRGMASHAILSCEAVFRSGTGVLTLGFPEVIKEEYKDILPEAMTLLLPSTPSGSIARSAKEKILEQVKSSDVVIIGPGLSTNAETIQLVWELLFEIDKPIVLDADGITAYAKGIEVIRKKEDLDFLKQYLSKKKSHIIITPHPVEVDKIMKAINDDNTFDKYINPKYIELHKKDILPLLSEYLSATIVLKGHDTVVAGPGKDLIINKVGGAEPKTPKTGDVLSGVIGSFIAQNPDKAYEAICTAVYLHGLAGKIANVKVGERMVTASDIIRYLPEAIRISEN